MRDLTYEELKVVAGGKGHGPIDIVIVKKVDVSSAKGHVPVDIVNVKTVDVSSPVVA
jgi:hypothetical protein